MKLPLRRIQDCGLQSFPDYELLLTHLEKITLDVTDVDGMLLNLNLIHLRFESNHISIDLTNFIAKL